MTTLPSMPGKEFSSHGAYLRTNLAAISSASFSESPQLRTTSLMTGVCRRAVSGWVSWLAPVMPRTTPVREASYQGLSAPAVLEQVARDDEAEELEDVGDLQGVRGQAELQGVERHVRNEPAARGVRLVGHRRVRVVVLGHVPVGVRHVLDAVGRRDHVGPEITEVGRLGVQRGETDDGDRAVGEPMVKVAVRRWLDGLRSVHDRALRVSGRSALCAGIRRSSWRRGLPGAGLCGVHQLCDYGGCVRAAEHGVVVAGAPVGGEPQGCQRLPAERGVVRDEAALGRDQDQRHA